MGEVERHAHEIDREIETTLRLDLLFDNHAPKQSII
jgi:hypothetical protein